MQDQHVMPAGILATAALLSAVVLTLSAAKRKRDGCKGEVSCMPEGRCVVFWMFVHTREEEPAVAVT